MNKTITLLMCIAIALVSVACNLSSSAGASLELTPAEQSILTATPELDDVVTEEPSTEIETEEPNPVVVEQPANNGNNGGSTGQLPATAVLPEVTLPLIQPAGQPSTDLCTVYPTNQGTLINVRRGADLGYETIMQLKTWAVVKYEVNGWYGIDIDGPHDAFVSSTVTKLQGNCAFLNPTPFPTRDSSQCYLDIPLAAGIEVPYFSEPQRYGTQQKGIINTTQLLIRGEKAGWYDVISYQGTRGWVPANIGRINGNCSNIPTISYDGTICIIVAYDPGYAYFTPFTGSDQFGPVSEGIGLPVMAKAVNNWYGYDNSGNVNPTAEPLSALRWVHRNESNRFYPVGDCDEIPVVYDEASDWDIAIETAGNPPADGCSVRSNTAPWVNYIYSGIETPKVIGVLNTYAPFVSLGDKGHVIELPDGGTGWVSSTWTTLVGTACPA